VALLSMDRPEALLRLVQCSSLSTLVLSCERLRTAPFLALPPTGFIDGNIRSPFWLPLRPEEEQNRATIVPFLNRGNLTDHG
jgi:hypothetical protein